MSENEKWGAYAPWQLLGEAMVEHGIGNLNRLGDRHRPSSDSSRKSDPAVREESQPRQEHDQAELSEAVQVAFPLLRGRVLAATRKLVATSDAPEPHAFHEELPGTSLDAVRLIHAAQRWLLAAAGRSATALEIDAAFVEGHAEAVAILQEVGKWDAAVVAWFAEVEAVPGLAAIEHDEGSPADSVGPQGEPD